MKHNENYDNYVNCRLFGCDRLNVYKEPDENSDVIYTLHTSDTICVNVSYIRWSLTCQCFYTVRTTSGLCGYIRTNAIRLI